MVDKELIEIWRNTLKPSVSLWLLNTNYEEMGEQDKEEFERDFDEILDLALTGLKYKAQLSQEGTTTDTISRQAAIDVVNSIDNLDAKAKGGICINLMGLPPAQPDVPDTNVGDIDKFIDGIEEIFADLRERHVDNSVCGLCEYDGAYIGQSGDWCNECPGFERDDCFKLSDKTRKEWTEEIIKALPPAQPERKVGEWIQYDKRFPWRHHYKCSECGNYLDFSGVNAGRGSANFCPNCGADMREVKVKYGDEDTLQGGLMSAT